MQRNSGSSNTYTIRGTDRYWMLLIAVISCRNSKLLNHNVVVKGSSIKHHRNRRLFSPHVLVHKQSWGFSNLYRGTENEKKKM